jgi:hypothetical protein
VRAADVVCRQSDVGARLVAPLRPPRRFGWLFRIPPGATRTFELDETGLFVWRLCDGTNSVEQIVRAVAGHCGLTKRNAEISTAQFLRTLAGRGLIGLAIDAQPEAEP